VDFATGTGITRAHGPLGHSPRGLDAAQPRQERRIKHARDARSCGHASRGGFPSEKLLPAMLQGKLADLDGQTPARIT